VESEPSYTLWHPHLQSRKQSTATLEFYLTPDAFDKGPLPDLVFLGQVLSELGVKAQPMSGKLFSYRSSYHGTQEPGLPWQDKWPHLWRLTMRLTNTPKRLPLLKHEGKLIYALPNTMESDDAPLSCLVIADFEKGRQAVRTRTKVLEFHSALGEKRGRPAFSLFEVKRFFVQLRIDLGFVQNSFFARGASFAREIEEICRREGGLPSFEERAEQWDAPYNPKGLE
jgi:hypothetical protein